MGPDRPVKRISNCTRIVSEEPSLAATARCFKTIVFQKTWCPMLGGLHLTATAVQKTTVITATCEIESALF